MEPANFDFENATLSMMKGLPDIPAYVGHDPQSGCELIVTSWEPDEKELAEIIRTRRVWVALATHKFPGIRVLGATPFPAQDNPEMKN